MWTQTGKFEWSRNDGYYVVSHYGRDDDWMLMTPSGMQMRDSGRRIRLSSASEAMARLDRDWPAKTGAQ